MLFDVGRRLHVIRLLNADEVQVMRWKGENVIGKRQRAIGLVMGNPYYLPIQFPRSRLISASNTDGK